MKDRWIDRLQNFHDLDEGYVRLAAGILFRDIATYPEEWQASQLEKLSNSYIELKYGDPE